MQISDAEQGDSLYHSGFIDRSGNVLLFFLSLMISHERNGFYLLFFKP